MESCMRTSHRRSLLLTGMAILLVACSASHDDPAPPRPEPVESIGVPECDAYLTKLPACSKAPRATRDQQLQTSRAAWKDAARDPASRSNLARSCVAAEAFLREAPGCR